MKRFATLSALLWLLSLPLQGLAQNAAAPQNDIKMAILSLGSGSTRLSYERAIGEQNTFEATVGLISLGWDIMNHAHPVGAGLKFAYKWTLLPQKGLATPLAGLYVKPEIQLAHFTNRYDPESNSRYPFVETQSTVLLGEVGYQLILRWFVFDIYAGLGVGLHHSEGYESGGTPSSPTGASQGATSAPPSPTRLQGQPDNYYHGVMFFPASSPLAFTAGFRIGYAF